MGLFCSNYNAAPAPAQPSYGEGMADAMAAQMQQLLGTGTFGEIYEEAGYKDADFGDILREVEGPLRKQGAQIDTDVLRQTILGDSQTARTITEADVNAGAHPSSLGKVGVPQSGFSYEKGDDKLTGGALDAQNQHDFIQETIKSGINPKTFDSDWFAKADRLGFEGSDGETGGRVLMFKLATFGGPSVTAEYSKNLKEYETEIEKAGGQLVPTQTFTTTNPKTGEAFKEGEVVRAGEGMVDLLGDARAVQESVKGDGDYASYVSNDPDLIKAFNEKNAILKSRWEPEMSIEEWGREHYETTGKGEGREVPGLGYSLQDAGRQAGFDESGKFLGLSALAEDIGRGGQQRAREADISDVERLGGRATDAYRAQGDLSGALAQARGIGAGGEKGLSAIPKDPLFEGAALDSLEARTAAENKGIDAITSEGMTAIMARSPNALRAATDYRPTADIAGGEIGADTLRTALMSDAETSLAGGLTGREERQISEAMKAQSTMMGRTFDQSAGLAEAKARLLEDRNRQALNRQYAQQVLGQEAGLQQSDLGRGLQASLANQQAANRAAEFGVGSGMQQEQAQAQLDQQTVLANQAARQDAARYSAQEEMQAKQMELGRQTAGVERQLTAEEKDIERIMRQQAMEEQYRQQGLGAERANAAQMVGLEQATSADPFQAILQRQGQNNLASGGALFGQAGYGLQSGPQYLNPEAGLGFISNQATNAANMFNAQQAADATRSAGLMGGLGNIAGGIFQGAGAAGSVGALFCWVAREVYGAHNPAWLDFRQWMFSSAPRWFFKLYLTFGERFANFIKDKPRLKARIRMWMDSKIGR